MKTVLVFGATGALGVAVSERLRKENYRVVKTSRNANEEVDFELDICDQAQVASLLLNVKPDLVLQFAATFINDFEKSYAVNVEVARHLLEEIKRLGFQTRVLLIGSAAEYGVIQQNENPVREDHVLNPVSIYGLTKAWQTQLAGLYESLGVDVLVARVFNLDGPKISERLFIGRIQKQIEDILAGQKVSIEVGPLSAIRDYVSTAEAANQIMAIVTYGKVGQVYHVGSGIPIKMRDILKRYLTRHNLDISIVKEASDLTNRMGYDAPVIYADMTKTMQLMLKWSSGANN